MAVTVFVGAYAYAKQVLDALPEPPMGYVTEDDGPRWQRIEPAHAIRYPNVEAACMDLNPDLVVVAGWRRLVPILAPTVGFHSAKLPEYPGRAPVPNAILRGDPTLTNTMLWLDDGVDTGDIIDEWVHSIGGKDPDRIYEDIGRSSAAMLRTHWRALLDGTAPRRPQDMTLRGPLTPAGAWPRLGGEVTGAQTYVLGPGERVR
jgi:methionyl-tRNA formyltransferase